MEPRASPERGGDWVSRRHGRVLDGWLVIDKPAGLTSAGVVNRVRRAFDARKAGHGGTLDPIATGVLPIAFGQATKTVPFVMDGTKTYRFTLRFGESRTTDDSEGEVTQRSDHRPDDASITEALAGFIGDIMQVPPAFSAIKVAGERAYDMARDGRPPTLPPRAARVDAFTLVARPEPDLAVFEVRSGKGVYMRSLARDLALATSSVGHVAALRRLRVGPFEVADAISLDKLGPGAENAHASPDLLLPIATALADIPALALTVEEAGLLSNGRALGLEAFDGRIPVWFARPHQGLVRAMVGEHVLGLCRLLDGRLVPERLLQPL